MEGLGCCYGLPLSVFCNSAFEIMVDVNIELCNYKANINLSLAQAR